MKKLFVLTTAIISLGLAPAFAQPGPHGGGQGPDFGGVDGQTLWRQPDFFRRDGISNWRANGEKITMPGKISFDTGKSRFEINMSEMQGAKMPPAPPSK